MRIEVDSPVTGPSAFVFERLSAHEELGRPYRYDVYLLSTNRDISLTALLGKMITVHVEIALGVKRHFGGYVAKARALGNVGRSARYHVELRPWLYLLRDRATCRLWQQQTVVNVLQDVVAKADFSLLTASSTVLSGSEWEYLVQYRESDYNFFMRLVEQEGLHFYFRQEENKHELLLSDDAMVHDSAYEDRRIAFQPPAGGHEIADDVITSWTVQEQLRPTHYELDDYDYKIPGSDLFARSGGPEKVPKSGGKGASEDPDRPAYVFDYPGEYVTRAEAEQLTTKRQQELRVDRQIIIAQANVRDLSAGSVFTLYNHLRDGENGKYYVTAMDLELEAAAVESGKGGGSFVFRGTYALLKSAIPFRLKRTTPKPVIAGLQTAVVVGPKGQEIQTDEQGRVRVKFRWDRTDKSKDSTNEGEEVAGKEDSSCWIRVAQPWASTGFGFQFIPRIGDEVVVQFLEGDPDRPLITGSVYNGTHKYPFSPGANPTQSGIKTRSSREGEEDDANIIRFEDKKKEEELFVQAQKKHTVKVKEDRSVSVGGNETYGVTGTRDTTITKKNTDIYKDEHKMEVTKKVEEIFHDEHTLTVTKKQTITVLDSKEETVSPGYKLTAKSSFLLTQGAEAGAGTTMKFEGDNVTFDVKGGITIMCGGSTVSIDKMGKVSIDSPVTGISLSCGGNTLALTPEGCTVTGMIMNLN